MKSQHHKSLRFLVNQETASKATDSTKTSAEYNSQTSKDLSLNLQLSPRDEAIFLLHSAAEIEHALLIQYLYAAYSLDLKQDSAEKTQLVSDWSKTIITIAKEEMFHLASVQNLLLLIGGSLNLEREDFPFHREIYPFRFKLEPLTKDSLSKYVFAEMPPGLTGADIDEITKRANRANIEIPLNHVGALYRAITSLFIRKNENGDYYLSDGDLQANSVIYQSNWGGGTLINHQIKTREDAIKILSEIAQQGEGLSDLMDPKGSHYVRFRSIYDVFPEKEDKWKPTRNIPTNPNTSLPDLDPSVEKDLKNGRITNVQTLLWAQLLNLRYRILLTQIFHTYHLANETDDRSFLEAAFFSEMPNNISPLSEILMGLPLCASTSGSDLPKASPPFEMPYTLALPDSPENRWRTQRDLIFETRILVAKLRQADLTDDQKLFLDQLSQSDDANLEFILTKIPKPSLTPIPEVISPTETTRFTQIVQILEEAVSGDTIGAHGNFWRDKTRDQFINQSIFGRPLIKKNLDGSFDDNESNLIKALEGRVPFGKDVGTLSATFRRMPAGRLPVSQENINIIRQWIKDGCPDNTM